MRDLEEKLHVWDFDPLTKKEFIKLMHDVACLLEESNFLHYEDISKKANALREIARRVHYSGKAYREDPEKFYLKYSKPIACYNKGNNPGMERAIVEKCLSAVIDLAEPVIDEIEGLLISKRWHRIPSSNTELAIAIRKRDAYLFVVDLIGTLWKVLYELEITREIQDES